MTFGQYYRSTLEECFMMLSAHDDKRLHDWKQTRFISFLIYCSATTPDKRKAKNEFEFLPLTGDPSAEELEKAQRDEVHERYRRAMEMSRAIIEETNNKIRSRNAK